MISCIFMMCLINCVFRVMTTSRAVTYQPWRLWVVAMVLWHQDMDRLQAIALCLPSIQARVHTIKELRQKLHRIIHVSYVCVSYSNVFRLGI